MSEVSDRVAKGMVRAINNAPFDPSQTPLQREMNALLSHGLRELIDANEHTYQALMSKHDRQDAVSEQRKLREPAALLGEPPTVKGEK